MAMSVWQCEPVTVICLPALYFRGHKSCFVAYRPVDVQVGLVVRGLAIKRGEARSVTRGGDSVGEGGRGGGYPVRDGNSPNYLSEVIPVLHYGRHHAARPSVSHIIFVFITLRLWPYISPWRDIPWRVCDILPALLSGPAQFLPPSALLPWSCNYKSAFVHGGSPCKVQVTLLTWLKINS